MANEVEAALRSYKKKPALREITKTMRRLSGEWIRSEVYRPGEHPRDRKRGMVFQDKGDGELWLALGYLKHKESKYSAIQWSLWYKGLERPLRELNPAVNGGKLRAALAPVPRLPDEPEPVPDRPQSWVVVWLQADADTVLGYRTDARKRQEPTGWGGRWIANTWHDDEYGPCLRDDDLEKELGRHGGFCSHIRVSHKRRRHPALGPSVNGGRPRHKEVPKFIVDRKEHVGSAGQVRAPRQRSLLITVSCWADFKAISDWDRAEEEKNSKPAPPGWKTAAEIAELLPEPLRSREDKLLLSFVLAEFRRLHEKAVYERNERRDRRTSRNRPSNFRVTQQYYNPEVFFLWLGTRHVRTVAGPLRRVSDRTARKRLRQAVLFLYFVLTRGSFDLKAYKRFLANPPEGQQLEPCSPVANRLVYAWAKQAGISVSKVLKKAKAATDTKHRWVAEAKGGTTEWYLETPVVIPSTEDPSRKRRGRKPGSVDKSVKERDRRVVEAAKTGVYAEATELATDFDLDPSYTRKLLKAAGIQLKVISGAGGAGN